ncbi:MAG: hypothetical protein ACXV7J_05550 [Methylomonas sp.]
MISFKPKYKYLISVALSVAKAVFTHFQTLILNRAINPAKDCPRMLALLSQTKRRRTTHQRAESPRKIRFFPLCKTVVFGLQSRLAATIIRRFSGAH